MTCKQLRRGAGNSGTPAEDRARPHIRVLLSKASSNTTGVLNSAGRLPWVAGFSALPCAFCGTL